MNRISESQDLLDCVGFMLFKDGSVLSEKRKLSKKVAPGAVALPGGHMEPGEWPEAALDRELREELGVVAISPTFVCSLLHRAQEFRRVHYFAVERWRGRMRSMEADGLEWISLNELDRLDLDVDRVAIGEYLRIYKGALVELAR